MARLVTAYLGDASVLLDGSVTTFGSRRTDALFAYLTHTGVAHSREHLADLLWEPGNPARSAGNLRVLLSNLRRQVGPYVDISRSAVQFTAAGDDTVWVDSARFLASAQKSLVGSGSGFAGEPSGEDVDALRAAADMCKGDFLARLDLQGAPTFDHWLRDERARIHGLHARVLTRLVEEELRAGEYDAAVENASLLIRVEPWADLSHQLMIRARRATGDDIGAVRHFDMFDAQHRAEFGAPAGAATRDLVSDLLHHDQPVPTASASATAARRGPSERRQPWSRFAGRRAELGTIVSRYAEAAAGRGNVVVVRGASGTGKTALVRRAVNLLVERDPALVVLGGAGEDPAQSGGGDLLVDRLLAQRGGDINGGWLDGPMVGPVAERIRALARMPDDTSQHGSALTRLASSIRELAGRHPVLLLVDDFQWTTPSTRNLLAELARGIHARSLFVLVAAQPGHGTSAVRGVGSPSWLLDRIGETMGLTVVDLDELQGGTAARTFVEAIIGGEKHALPGELVDELVRLGAGHPLTTVELLRDLVKRGQVVPDRADRLRLEGKVSWPSLPDRLVRLLEGQVAALPDDLQGLLEVAAAHGPSFHFAAVARSDGRDLTEVSRALGRHLGPRGYRLLEPLEGEAGLTHRFRQPVLREHLLARMDPHERRVLEARVAEAAED